MLSGAILGRVDRTMAERAVRGNRPLEMSKPTYRELATNFDLWRKFVLLEEQVSEREFNRCLSTKSSISFRDATPTLSNTARSPKMLRRRIRNQDIFDLIAAAGSLLCGLLVRTKWLDRSTVVVEFLIGFQRLLVSHCDASE